MARKNTRPSLAWLRDLLNAPASESDTRMPRSEGAIFDAEQVQDCSGSAGKGRAVLEAVLTQGPRILDRLGVAHRSQEIDVVLNQVHDLRGLAQILGAYAIAQGCLRVELQYETASLEERDELVAYILLHVTPLVDSIRLYLDSWAA